MACHGETPLPDTYHSIFLQTNARNHSVVDDPTVAEIAKKLNKDPAALLISWAVQRGSAVLPKSVTPSRIESNFQGRPFAREDVSYTLLICVQILSFLTPSSRL